jgi:hypothetical protein
MYLISHDEVAVVLLKFVVLRLKSQEWKWIALMFKKRGWQLLWSLFRIELVWFCDDLLICFYVSFPLCSFLLRFESNFLLINVFVFELNCWGNIQVRGNCFKIKFMRWIKEANECLCSQFPSFEVVHLHRARAKVNRNWCRWDGWNLVGCH